VSIGRIETDGSPDTPSGSYCGWHSEHLGTEDRIHLWDTSQVLLFLVQYSGMLRRHIARTTLKKSYLQQRWLKPRAKAAPSRRGNGPEDDETGEEEAARKNQLWQAQVQNWEPLPGLSDGSPYRIYTRISDYVRQHAVPPTELKRRYSILLYGPPGTGKTSLAEAIAKTLGFPLVTVTPSDFLAAGPGDVERRAKELFEALQWQSETLILLDEIDHFLLDRESRLYRDQTGIFQFLTPGMLTKIKGLHDAMRPLFIIATNYAERIDPAIKRPGRIDDRLPLLPFDSIRRAARLETHCSREIRELRKKGASEAALEWEHSRGEVVHATRLWTDGELIELVRSAGALVTGPSPPNFGEALKEAIPRIRPTITLASYSSRFRDVEPPDNSEFPTEQEPFEEFYLLVYLACENSLSGADPFPAELSQQDRTMIVEVVKRELEIQREDFEEFRKRVEPPELTGTGLVRDVGDPDLRGVILRLLWEVAKEASP
jgi:DNA polymerase III delta prime subunit